MHFKSFLIAATAGVLAGCTTYVQSPPPPQAVYVPPPPAQPPVEYVPAPPPPVYTPAPAPAVVVIHTESDFYEPLQPYGRWVEVAGYGRCWTPSGVDPDWRPYTDGHWQRTDAGWYWVSDERWGWATCHYGRWRRDVHIGWVWIPQTQWAPAWVEWREGGGYTGWAPLPPEARFGPGGVFQHREADLDAHAFVFVKEDQMLQPHRHQTVIINNTTIINKTVNVTKIQVVNNTVVNEGPRPEVIARAAGRARIDAVPARTLRTEQESRVINRPVRPTIENAKPENPKPENFKPANPVTGGPGKPVIRPEPKPVHPPMVTEHPINQPKPVVTEPGHPPRPLTPAQLKPDTHARTNLPPEHKRELNRPVAQPATPPKVAHPDTPKPPPHVAPEKPAPHTPAVKPADQKNLTPQQKADLERKKKLEDRRRQNDEKAHPESTNAPAAPH